MPRVACLLNARGTLADPATKRSRGELPLRAAAGGAEVLGELAGDPAVLAAYDPFILICATTDTVTALTWLGPASSQDAGAQAAAPLAVRELAPGTHLFTNAGHAYPAGPGDPKAEPKAVHFAEKFAAARPSADPALGVAPTSISAAWGDWLTLAAGDGLDPADPAAIVVGRDLPDGRVYGSTSMTLIGLGDGAVRYDFQPRPGEGDSVADGWYSVAMA